MKHPRLRSEKNTTYVGHELDHYIFLIIIAHVIAGFQTVLYILQEIQQNAQSGDGPKKNPGVKNRPIELKNSG